MLMEAAFAKIFHFISQKQKDDILTDLAAACRAKIYFFSLYFKS
jgi:hypothetical protein